MLDKNEIKKVLSLEGKVRGGALNTDVKYILKTQGEDGLKKVTKELKKIVPDIKYGKEVSNIEWYPLSWRVFSLLVAKDTFNWSEKDIFDMGHSAPNNSFIVKTLLRYFISMEKTFKEATKYWDKHYSIGTLEAYEINLKKKYIIPIIKDFKIHPDLCIYYAGYFQALSELILKDAKDVSTKEVECPFHNGKDHKYLITWK